MEGGSHTTSWKFSFFIVPSRLSRSIVKLMVEYMISTNFIKIYCLLKLALFLVFEALLKHVFCLCLLDVGKTIIAQEILVGILLRCNFHPLLRKNFCNFGYSSLKWLEFSCEAISVFKRQMFVDRDWLTRLISEIAEHEIIYRKYQQPLSLVAFSWSKLLPRIWMIHRYLLKLLLSYAL